MSEIVSALSRALDLTEGQPFGHAARSCVVGMRVAHAVGLEGQDLSDLFYALLLKDAGCTANAAATYNLFRYDDREAKRRLKTVNWSHTASSVRYAASIAAAGQPLPARLAQLLYLARKGTRAAQPMFALRCERGADIIRLLGFPETVAQAVYALDEHFDGAGYPKGLRGQDIPILSRIASLAQTFEVLAVAHGTARAVQMVRRRAGSWFDPALVTALCSFAQDERLLGEIGADPGSDLLAALEPQDHAVYADDAQLDRIAEAFAQVIDAKSPFTYQHSTGVAKVALGIAATLGLPADRVRDVRRAALLHDIGKLGVPNTILDKPDKLTDEEFAVIRRHPAYTVEILGRVDALRGIVEIAGSHHERLDGRGYHRGIALGEQDVAVRLLPVADVYDALTSDRPYRRALPQEQALDIMRRQVGGAFCPDCFAAFEQFLGA